MKVVWNHKAQCGCLYYNETLIAYCEQHGFLNSFRDKRFIKPVIKQSKGDKSS